MFYKRAAQRIELFWKNVSPDDEQNRVEKHLVAIRKFFFQGDCRAVCEGRQRIKRWRSNPNSICCEVGWYVPRLSFYLSLMMDLQNGTAKMHKTLRRT